MAAAPLKAVAPAKAGAPAKGAAAEKPAEAPKPRKRPWLLIAGAAVLVLACAGGAAWLLLGRGAHKGAAAAKPVAPIGPPLYLALLPPFTTNFEGDQTVRYLQISAQVMSHDQPTIDLLKANDPIVRNDLLLLFSNQKAADLASREGKEKLRAAALSAIQHVVTENGGDGTKVNAVLFTSFVMQ
jgi:flagellar protein FliL